MVSRQPHVSGRTAEPGLSVGLLRIGLLNGMPGEQPIGIRRTSRLHSSWRRPEISEYCPIGIGIAHVVPLEHGTAFAFASFVSGIKLVILLYDNPEYEANMDGLA